MIPSTTVSANTQNLSNQITQWFVPLDLGDHLKIQCLNGSLVEFVSECTSPHTCKALLLSGNDTLECIPSSKFDKTGDQLIFP
ncbi:MAG: hypothetical protein M3530_10975 [Thermoproteota archaeon]|nr:hypothetical protein [Thermoproteota archaeon]